MAAILRPFKFNRFLSGGKPALIKPVVKRFLGCLTFNVLFSGSYLKKFIKWLFDFEVVVKPLLRGF